MASSLPPKPTSKIRISTFFIENKLFECSDAIHATSKKESDNLILSGFHEAALAVNNSAIHIGNKRK